MTDNEQTALAVLEEAMEASLEGFHEARARHDEAGAAAFYHVLSIAMANADAMDLKFSNNDLNDLDLDALLKGKGQRAA